MRSTLFPAAAVALCVGLAATGTYANADGSPSAGEPTLSPPADVVPVTPMEPAKPLLRVAIPSGARTMTLENGTICSEAEAFSDSTSLWRCVDVDGNEFFGWKSFVGCAALGAGASLLFTPAVGITTSVTCRILTTPSPAYSYAPTPVSGGYGGWDDSDFFEQGDFYYDEYYYDPVEDEYLIEVLSFDYPESDSYEYNYGGGGTGDESCVMEPCEQMH